MKKLILFSLTVLSLNGFSQDYFQQKVDYEIDVKLYDTENVLRGFETFEYFNNSKDELTFIYVHLWPNGYKNTETALARQLYDMGNRVMEEAPPGDFGYIDSLDFKVNNETVKWELDENHIDICKVTLNEPLKPGEKMTVSTPFKVKIPSGDISRLGFVGESYQITQWYPKPAVYDTDGWHQMPYLTQGEFYSEYGSYDVSITLPKNYVVGSTGDLQTASEIEFLEERVAATEEKFDKDKFSVNASDEFPASVEEWKTIRYTQKDVHDFAWFADKRFEVLKGEVELPGSGRTVTSWAMFVPDNYKNWEDAIEYLNDATYYYSKWNGDYPYNHVTAVDGTISAGGGMEYPNVTVIGNAGSKEDLEVVIVHEVGHNWFYGLLGSNERDHAWMDEGLNTLNEIRYMQTKYPKNTRMTDMARGVAHQLHIHDLSHQDMSDATYRMVASFGLDQPIELHAADYTSLNYGAIVYAKTGVVFMYLKDYLGDDLFDKAMRTYYDEWHYRHPQPDDFRKVMERETGKDLSWVFEDLIQTTKQIDYKIRSVKVQDGKSTVKVKNTGQIESPVRVDALSFGKIRETQWIEPGETEATFDGTSFDQFVIDAERQMPEVNRNNNFWTKKGLFHRTEPFKLSPLFAYNRGDEWNSYFLPAVGMNVYDKFMLGVLLHNQTIPKNKFEYTIAPMFSFGRKNISGFADFNYGWIPANNIRMITLGVLSKTFGTGIGVGPADDQIATYYTVQPYLRFDIGKPKEKKHYKQGVKLQGHYIVEVGENFDNTLTGGSLNYKFRYNKRIHTFNAGLKVDYYDIMNNVGPLFQVQSNLLRSGLELEYRFVYWQKKRTQVTLRTFLGQTWFYNTNGVKNSRYGYALGGQSGTQDVTYDHYMFGRNEYSGFWSNQRIENQGGFRTTSDYGNTNGTLFTTNLYVEIPFIRVFGVYADYGVFETGGTMIPVYDAGVGLRIADRLAVYFPFYESNNLKNSFTDGTNYVHKIRFSINMEGLSLKNVLSSVF